MSENILENPALIKHIDVVRIQGSNVHVLGRNGRYFTHAVHNRETGEILEDNYFIAPCSEKRFDTYRHLPPVAFPLGLGVLSKNRKPFKQYLRTRDRFFEQNEDDLNAKETVRNIPIYNSWESAERDLGPLEVVKFPDPRKFVEAEDEFWLRVRAYELGGEAIVDFYKESEVSGLYAHKDPYVKGTPVKIKHIQ
jgi:hypothetical protein